MKFLTRKLVTHEDLNPRGYLHGGQMLKWIDEEGGIHAGLELNTGLIVTKYISDNSSHIDLITLKPTGFPYITHPISFNSFPPKNLCSPQS